MSEPGPTFVLQRVAIHPAGAFGVLLYGGLPFAVTLERTYDMAPAPCCHGVNGQWIKIPPGHYRCPRGYYHKGAYPTFEIPVPGHRDIKLHKANWEGELDGCVAVAAHFGDFEHHPGVLMGESGFRTFMIRAAGEAAIDLEIRDPVGP